MDELNVEDLKYCKACLIMPDVHRILPMTSRHYTGGVHRYYNKYRTTITKDKSNVIYCKIFKLYSIREPRS